MGLHIGTIYFKDSSNITTEVYGRENIDKIKNLLQKSFNSNRNKTIYVHIILKEDAARKEPREQVVNLHHRMYTSIYYPPTFENTPVGRIKRSWYLLGDGCYTDLVNKGEARPGIFIDSYKFQEKVKKIEKYLDETDSIETISDHIEKLESN